MKAFLLLALVSIPAMAEEPAAQPAPPAPAAPTQNPVDICKSQASFKYNFEMMKIEGEEIRGAITHRQADEMKSKTHGAHKEALEDCDDLKKD